MKRTLLTLTLAAALCLPALFAQKSAAEEPIVLTFNLGMPPIHQRWVNAIKPWCDELEKRSNGRIKIEPYFANALGKRSDAMDSVRTGIADLAEAPFSSNPGAFPFHSQIFSAANPSMALGNAYEMLSDFYKAHPEVLKKEIKGVKLMFIHAYPVGDCVMTKSAPILKLDDIKGKKLGAPVYELIGGRVRDKIRMYSHTGGDTPEQAAANAKKRVEQGFDAVKISPDAPVKHIDHLSYVDALAEKFCAIREAVGKGVDIAIDFHGRIHAGMASRLIDAIAPYYPMFVEEPVLPENVEVMASIAAKTSVPIATGERAIDLREFEVLMARHACQYVRPDVCAVGGITTSKKICALAEAHDVLVIPHNPLGPVSTAACLQICASIPNLGIQELPGFCLNGAEDKMVKEPLRFENGCMLIPEAPGIGIELADDAEELYPANERGSNAARRAFDGAVKDW